MIIDAMSNPEYTIGITFVGWLIALLLLHGFSIIKSAESILKNETYSDESRMGAELIIEQYNNKNLGDRVIFLLTMSVAMLTGGKLNG